MYLYIAQVRAVPGRKSVLSIPSVEVFPHSPSLIMSLHSMGTREYLLVHQILEMCVGIPCFLICIEQSLSIVQ